MICKRHCEDNPPGENSSFNVTVYVKSVPLHHFKLAHVVLHMVADLPSLKHSETHAI